jgi:Tol biopolymer transport system component
MGYTDWNNSDDIYVHDLGTGETVLASAEENGEAGSAGPSPVFSADSTRIAYVAGSNVYVRDLTTGTRTLVSIDATGTQPGNNGSYAPVFSPDGTKVAFVSSANDLGPTDPDTYEDVYVRDLVAGTTRLVSVDASGTDAASSSSFGVPGFSPDGESIYFQSSATDLVATPDANGDADLFARDLTTGTTTLVTTNAAGTASGNSGAGIPVLSRDGTKLAFQSSADDLGPTDANGHPDVYVRDLRTGTTSLASARADGEDSGNHGRVR